MPISSAKTKRVPKEGCFFTGLRILAVLAKILGGLMLIGGMVGTIITLIKSAPDIISGVQYLDQGLALFVLTLIATYFGVFAGLGCLGLIVIGFGFLLDFLSSEPGREQPIDKPSASA